LFTPAYWAAQAWHHANELVSAPLRIGKSLTEEVVACILGGHGAPAEIGLAAFEAVRAAKLTDGPSPTASEVEEVIARPLDVGGRLLRYRFARQRSRYVAAAIGFLRRAVLNQDCHRKFRDELTSIDGIGLKTASWITRNWLDSDEVAVLDIHILRAGCIMKLFPADANLGRDYKGLENSFLSFANAISVRPSRLDALMWRQMRTAGDVALRCAARA
jgi:thermostable 8-oxoguanine DNA glycosylase